MSRRNQPNQPPKPDEQSFEQFLAESGVIQLDPSPTPEAFWSEGETAFDSQLPGKSPMEVVKETIDAALLHQAQAPVGYPLNQALSKSPYLRLAARLLPTNPSIVIVSNGFRTWTANLTTFEPILVEFNPNGQLQYEDWQPVYGDDRGLYMGARK